MEEMSGYSEEINAIEEPECANQRMYFWETKVEKRVVGVLTFNWFH